MVWVGVTCGGRGVLNNGLYCHVTRATETIGLDCSHCGTRPIVLYFIIVEAEGSLSLPHLSLFISLSIYLSLSLCKSVSSPHRWTLEFHTSYVLYHTRS